MWLSRVVFPAPRKPVSTLIGMIFRWSIKEKDDPATTGSPAKLAKFKR
jgi:hypothetical protein